MVANIRDVTDQTESEEALATSESLYRSIVETAEEGITIHDLEGRFTFANAKMATLVGIPVDRLVGGTILDLVPPADRCTTPTAPSPGCCP